MLIVYPVATVNTKADWSELEFCIGFMFSILYDGRLILQADWPYQTVMSLTVFFSIGFLFEHDGFKWHGPSRIQATVFVSLELVFRKPSRTGLSHFSKKFFDIATPYTVAPFDRFISSAFSRTWRCFSSLTTLPTAHHQLWKYPVFVLFNLSFFR